MCSSEFNQIIDAIAAVDVDVISIETSRSKMELLDGTRDPISFSLSSPGGYVPAFL